MSSAASNERGSKRRMPFVLALFLSIFIGVGAIGALALAIDFVRGLETYFWSRATCTIDHSEAVYKPAFGEYVFEVAYRYRARGEERAGDTFRVGYTGSETEGEARVLASRFPVGSEVSCWVDPEQPDRSALRRSNLWEGLWIFVPLLFVAVGCGVFWLFRNPDIWTRGKGPKSKSVPTTRFVAGFFGIFLFIGLAFLVPFFLWPLVQVVEARSWKETPCEILSSSVRTHSGDDGDTYSIEVLYRYEVGGREYLSDRYQFLGGSTSGYEGKAEVVRRLGEGTRTSCWVDPRDPEQAVVERGLRPGFLFGLIPLLFVIVGAGGTWAAISTARRARAAAAGPSWVRPVVTPPSDADPGSIELEPATGPVTRLVVTGIFALIWNGILAVFVWKLYETWRTGDVDWVLALVLLPFVLVGLLALASLPYSLLQLLNPRPRLRLSRAILRPGESAQVEWSFRGRAGRIERLTLRLEGHRVRSEEGGTRKTELQPFETIELVRREKGFGLEYGAATVEIPDGVPDPGTAIWKLKLHGDIPLWPDVREEFEIEVRENPSDAGTPAD